MRKRFGALALATIVAMSAGLASAAVVSVNKGAQLQDNTGDVDEAAQGFYIVKYVAPPVAANDTALRKAYLQFDLTGQAPDYTMPATLTLQQTTTNTQNIRLWALNQAYPTFDASTTYANAQANDTTSNELLTTGPATATSIATLAVGNSVIARTLTLPAGWGAYVFNNQITLAITGTTGTATNSTGGFRFLLGSSATPPTLSFSSTPEPASLALLMAVALPLGRRFRR